MFSVGRNYFLSAQTCFFPSDLSVSTQTFVFPSDLHFPSDIFPINTALYYPSDLFPLRPIFSHQTRVSPQIYVPLHVSVPLRPMFLFRPMFPLRPMFPFRYVSPQIYVSLQTSVSFISVSHQTFFFSFFRPVFHIVLVFPLQTLNSVSLTNVICLSWKNTLHFCLFWRPWQLRCMSVTILTSAMRYMSVYEDLD